MPTDTLPASIVNALPTSAEVMKHFAAIAKLTSTLDKEIKKAQKNGSPSLARAYVALHRMKERSEDLLGPLFGSEGIYKRVKEIDFPALCEQEGIKNVPLTEGFRVGVSSRFLASIKPDQKDAAYNWLRANGLADLITSTVNAGTLSAAGKRLVEDDNKELPPELFNSAYVPNTSVTKA